MFPCILHCSDMKSESFTNTISYSFECRNTLVATVLLDVLNVYIFLFVAVFVARNDDKQKTITTLALSFNAYKVYEI